MSFLDELAKKGLIKKSEIDQISQEAESGGIPIDDALKKRGLLEKDVLELRGEYLNIPVRDTDAKGVPFEVLRYVPEDSAVFYKFVPLGVVDGVLEVGMVDPENIEARNALQFISSKLLMLSLIITTKGRKNIKESNFALSGRRYPIHDISHARNALARVSQHGTSEEKKKVRNAVYRKYPSLRKGKKK